MTTESDYDSMTHQPCLQYIYIYIYIFLLFFTPMFILELNIRLAIYIVQCQLRIKYLVITDTGFYAEDYRIEPPLVYKL